MIRLAFSTDKRGIVGVTDLEEDQKRVEKLPKGLWDQLHKMAEDSHIVVGRHTFHYVEDREYDEERKLFILSHDAKWFIANDAVEIVRDAIKLIDKYTKSTSDITVLGGVETFKEFLPYAKELRIAVLKDEFDGDMVFDEWKDEGFDLEKSEDWGDGITYYYVKY